MKRLSIFILFGLIFVLNGCLSDMANVQTLPNIENFIVQVPEYKIGDKWIYNDKSVDEVIAFEDDLIVFNSSSRTEKNYHYYYDKDLVLRKALKANGKDDTTSVLDVKNLDFPLYVGKTWETSYWGTPVGSAAQKWFYKNTYTVLSYDEVTLKCGTFKAFQIKWEQVAGHGACQEAYILRWWSPELKRYIKQVVRGLYNCKWQDNWELVSYHLN